MLYAEATEHNPLELGPEPYGPFPKGEPLGVTYGEWLAATGTVVYTLEENDKSDRSTQSLPLARKPLDRSANSLCQIGLTPFLLRSVEGVSGQTLFQSGQGQSG